MEENNFISVTLVSVILLVIAPVQSHTAFYYPLSCTSCTRKSKRHSGP